MPKIHIPMFTRKDIILFSSAALLTLSGYLFMAFDPADYGFGVWTLWIAPPLLLAGFFLPIVALVDKSILPARWFTRAHLGGYIVFSISLITYLLTLEPTASLWDCSEFIASAYKLQVPHTPGTPLSLLFGRIFAMLATDVNNVALCVNAMSAFFSSLTVWISYHLIMLLLRPIIIKNEFSQIVGSLCGSLCLAFSDTFWFSAVEAETYGLACFFLMIQAMMIIKGRELTGHARLKWVILIFYMAGLSYCIHPMCILALPLLPFSWLTADKQLKLWSVTGYLASGLLLVFAINRIVGIGLFEIAFAMDQYLVNTLSLPFYSGAILLVTLLVVLSIIVTRRYSASRIPVLCITALLLGFLPYLMLFIRSNHNPPIDENNPENLPLIRAYMSRESYPTSPLTHGPYFDAQVENVTVKRKIFHKSAKGYEFSGTMSEYTYDLTRTTILPRMYSNDNDHIEAYRYWNRMGDHDQPTFSDNLYFMFTYQLGHMYLRYLMFNFSGRTSDHQNDPWLSPIDTLNSDSSTIHNKARNQYWMLPLFLGIIGAFIQFRWDSRGLIIVTVLFMINGIILVLYLNSPPIEPRERDYIYVGSFIAYCLWIGVGAAFVASRLSGISWLSKASLALLGVPLLMAVQNYDDHNRSGRTFQIENARNLLNSCAPNAILFTGGDNDTFPLWYIQDVEGVRTDVRVMVLSYMNTDWYINQLRRRYYDSEPFKLTLGPDEYLQYGANDVLYIQNSLKDGVDIKKYLQLLKDKHPAIRGTSSTGDVYSILPSNVIKLHTKETRGNETDVLTFQVTGNYLTKSSLAILDLVASNHWERPIYFNYTALNTAGLELQEHVTQEGNVYRLSQFNGNAGDIRIDHQLMYDNLISKADYSGLQKKHVYFNYEDYHARIITPLRQSFNTLATAYLREGNVQKADTVLSFALKQIHNDHLDPSYPDLQTADLLQTIGRDQEAMQLCRRLFAFHYERLKTDRLAGNPLQRIDLFLTRQSSAMLDSLGDSTSGKLLSDLRLNEER